MPEPHASPEIRHPTIVIVGLMLATFTTGSVELSATGLLPLLSAGLGVSIAAAGALVSAHALGLAIGGPLLTAATLRLDRRHALLGSLGLFVVVAASPTIIPGYGWFVVARFIAGALQGVLMAAAFTTASSLVSPERTGRAMGLVITGFALAGIIGLPIGVFFGSLMGWRGALLIQVAAAFTVGCALFSLLPSVPPIPLSGQDGLKQALAPRVLAVLALALVLFAAPAATQSYLVPLLEQVVRVPASLVSAVLFGFGLTGVIGSYLGGRLADIHAARVLIAGPIGIAVTLGALFLFRDQPVIAVAALLSLGVFSASMPPAIQYRIVELAGPGSLAASLPAAAANAGIAAGAGVGGIAYASTGPSSVALAGCGIALMGAVLGIVTRQLRGSNSARQDSPASPPRAPEKIPS
jgi:DHA1 family inner membrane transport protein